jgi:hypothetical protein
MELIRSRRVTREGMHGCSLIALGTITVLAAPGVLAQQGASSTTSGSEHVQEVIVVGTRASLQSAPGSPNNQAILFHERVTAVR